MPPPHCLSLTSRHTNPSRSRTCWARPAAARRRASPSQRYPAPGPRSPSCHISPAPGPHNTISHPPKTFVFSPWPPSIPPISPSPHTCVALPAHGSPIHRMSHPPTAPPHRCGCCPACSPTAACPRRRSARRGGASKAASGRRPPIGAPLARLDMLPPPLRWLTSRPTYPRCPTGISSSQRRTTSFSAGTCATCSTGPTRCALGPPGNASSACRVPHIQAH